MWISHSISLRSGFGVYLLIVTKETLRFLASSLATLGHKAAASTDHPVAIIWIFPDHNEI
ncbi:hypothetical protein DFY03_24430 [Escherichia coli]|nr:hypothetical protein [Escherichia coli]EFO2135562.1 hypothetical protein [Escherichia coli]